MSSIQMYDIHTPVKSGGQAITYQRRKKSKTCNMLIFTESQGMPLAYSDSIEGNHNDAFYFVSTVEKMIGSIQSCGIVTDGLFLNTEV